MTTAEDPRLKKTTWREYSTIDDMADLEKIQRSSGELEYIALEKVDGCNIAFETDGIAIEYFSRKQRLEKHSKFVGRTTPVEAMSRYHDFVLNLSRLCVAHFRAARIVVYGEYFGGGHGRCHM